MNCSSRQARLISKGWCMNRKLMGNLARVLAAAGWADKTLTSAEIENLKDLLFQFQRSVIDPREDTLFEMYIKSRWMPRNGNGWWRNYGKRSGRRKTKLLFSPR